MDVRDASVSNFVFVSTILPVIECEGCRGDLTSNAAIDQTNGLIRSRLVGATIVESNILFKASDPSLLSLLESDGLHPTPAGYTVLARAFETAIVNRIPITSLRRRR